MKRVIPVAVVLILALILAGCGGGTEGTPAGTTSTVSGTTATAAGTATAQAPEPRPTVPYSFVVRQDTPNFFKEALKKKTPIFLVFYTDDDPTSQAVMQEVKSVYDQYNGAADFMSLKVGENDEISRLAQQFRIGFVPYVAVINRSGTVIFEKNGYVDSKVLEQAVYNAVNK